MGEVRLVRDESPVEFFREQLVKAMEHQHVSTSAFTEYYLVNLLASAVRGETLPPAEPGYDETPLALLYARAPGGARGARLAAAGARRQRAVRRRLLRRQPRAPARRPADTEATSTAHRQASAAGRGGHRATLLTTASAGSPPTAPWAEPRSPAHGLPNRGRRLPRLKLPRPCGPFRKRSATSPCAT